MPITEPVEIPETRAPDPEETADEPTAEPGGPPEARIPPPTIRMSDAALEEARAMIREADLPPEGGIRLRARTGAGCSAPLQYGMFLEEEPRGDDVVLSNRGVRLLLDPESAWALDGLLIHYVESSPLGEGFTFRHPRGTSGRTC